MFLRVMLIAATAVFAARALAAPAPRSGINGVDGVITVQTITTAGHDFSQHFLAAWRDMDGSEYYTLSIRERPSARFGSEVWIDSAQRPLLQLRLPPARAALRGVAANAARQVWDNLQHTQAQRALLRDPDLAPDEFQDR